MRIFGYLKNHLAVIAVLVILLVIQALSELALPGYTSDIVDVGIMRGGIPDAVPAQIRSGSLKQLELFMSESEIEKVGSHYKLNDDGIYELSSVSAEERESLDTIFGGTMLIVYGIQNPSGESIPGIGGESAPDMDIASIEAGVDAGFITKEQLIERRDGAISMIGDMGDTAITQAAASYIKGEYEAIDIDLTSLQFNYMFMTGAKMLGLTLVSAIAAVLVCMLASRTAAKIAMKLRRQIYAKTLSFSHAEIDKFSTASLITRNTNDIQQIQMALVMVMRIVLFAPIMGIGGVIKVSGKATGMGWIIAVAVAAIMAAVAIMFAIAMPKFKKLQKLIDRLNLVTREILTGLPVIRAFSREKFEEKRFDTASRDLMKTQLFTNRTMSGIMPLLMFFMQAISVVIVWNGAYAIDAGNLLVGDMIAFITYTMQIVMSFMMLSMISIMLPRANVSAVRVDEVINTPLTILDKDAVLDDKVVNCNGEVRFDNVSFRFPGAGEDVLNGISFTASPGKTTAIIGSTGSGKSTLINLIPRFYDVTEGNISIDGVDIRDISQTKLHSLIGFVPQKGVLFSGTIESNLKFAGGEISDDDMKEAARIAQAAEFINEKDEKYASPIAQGGTNVSGGQKQRLSIARAVAKKPKVYIFDDSFSALDYKTDITLRRALGESVGDATVIIVAQRISTILRADQIIVLDEGRVMGIGTHSELIKSCETYREIASSQLSENEIKEVG
ncbi:ABC transporter [Clostridia bacterium]|nr:ABC transporter [Clostridia bacterium]